MNQSIGKISSRGGTRDYGQSISPKASVSSKTIVVQLPSDLPELAREQSDAMYLHHTHEAQAILYLETGSRAKAGDRLSVTDPANIKAVGQVSISRFGSVRFRAVSGRIENADSLPRSLRICGGH